MISTLCYSLFIRAVWRAANGYTWVFFFFVPAPRPLAPPRLCLDSVSWSCQDLTVIENVLAEKKKEEVGHMLWMEGRDFLHYIWSHGTSWDCTDAHTHTAVWREQPHVAYVFVVSWWTEELGHGTRSPLLWHMQTQTHRRIRSGKCNQSNLPSKDYREQSYNNYKRISAMTKKDAREFAECN